MIPYFMTLCSSLILWNSYKNNDKHRSTVTPISNELYYKLPKFQEELERVTRNIMSADG